MLDNSASVDPTSRTVPVADKEDVGIPNSEILHYLCAYFNPFHIP